MAWYMRKMSSNKKSIIYRSGVYSQILYMYASTITVERKFPMLISFVNGIVSSKKIVMFVGIIYKYINLCLVYTQ